MKLLEKTRPAVFPRWCAGCELEGEWWCKPCRQSLELAPARCPTCPRPTLWGETCKACQSRGVALAGLTVVFSYQEPALRELIQRFKYAGAIRLMNLWRQVLAERIELFTTLMARLPAPAVLMPVPLTKRRERERGFNQAAVLAVLFSELLSSPIGGGLKRQVGTAPQVGLSREERLANMEQAIGWEGGRAPRTVILVDDVVTTGATLDASARALKAAGSVLVWGMALARD